MDKKIYIIDPLKIKDRSMHIHNVIREKFPADKRYPSAVAGNKFLVISSTAPNVSFYETIDINLPKETDKMVFIESVFAFDKNLHGLATAIDKDAYMKKHYMSCQSALKKFSELAGLNPHEDVEIYHKGKVVKPATSHKKAYPILNVFIVGGYFHINNKELFEKALLDGVGNTYSYGHGLVLAKEYL